MLSNTPNNNFQQLKGILPPDHPYFQMIEQDRTPLDETKKLEKLKEIFPPDHPYIQMMEGKK